MLQWLLLMTEKVFFSGDYKTQKIVLLGLDQRAAGKSKGKTSVLRRDS